MVTSLLQHERITTTHAKAKAAQRLADKMIALGKEGKQTTKNTNTPKHMETDNTKVNT